jgi:hypothetical protein
MSKMEEVLSVRALRTDPTLKTPGEDAKVQGNRPADQKLCVASEGNCETAETD